MAEYRSWNTVNTEGDPLLCYNLQYCTSSSSPTTDFALVIRLSRLWASPLLMPPSLLVCCTQQRNKTSWERTCRVCKTAFVLFMVIVKTKIFAWLHSVFILYILRQELVGLIRCLCTHDHLLTFLTWLLHRSIQTTHSYNNDCISLLFQHLRTKAATDCYHGYIMCHFHLFWSRSTVTWFSFIFGVFHVKIWEITANNADMSISFFLLLFVWLYILTQVWLDRSIPASD